MEFPDGKSLVYAMDCPAEANGCGGKETVKLIVGPGTPPQGYCMSCGMGWNLPESSVAQMRADYQVVDSGTPEELFAKYKFQGAAQTESEGMNQQAQTAQPPVPPPPAAAAQPAPPPPAAAAPAAPAQPPAPAPQQAAPPAPAPQQAAPPAPAAQAAPPAPAAPAQPPAPAPQQAAPPAPPAQAAPAAPPAAPAAPEPEVEAVTEPEGGASVMHPPVADVDQTARPPQHLQSGSSQLEDPGDAGSDEVQEIYDAISAINAGMKVLSGKANNILQAAMPRPENMEKPLGGNPFEEKGSFKNEHIIFNMLSKGDWVPFGTITDTLSVAKTTAKSKVKSLDNLSGYTLHHHAETDSYCLTLSE